MRFRALTPMLWTDDLPSTIEFYTSVLEFKVNEYNSDWQWCSMSKDSVDIMYAKPVDHTPFTQSNFTGSFYFYVEDVDRFWEKLKNSSHIYYPIDNFIYGMREFAIKDNNGYILQFGEEIKKDQ